MVCTADGKAGIWLQFCLTLKRTLRLHQLILKLPQDPFVGTSCYHVVFFIQSLSQVRLFATPWTAAQEALSGFPVLHHFPEFAQTHAHRSQWCYPTISSSIVPFSSCLQSFPASGSFHWVSSSHQVTEILQLQLQHQSFQWIFRVDFF